MQDYYITVSYPEWEADYGFTDVVCFTLPGENMCPALQDAVDSALSEIFRDKRSGVLEWLDEVFQAVADRLHGSWKFVEISMNIEV